MRYLSGDAPQLNKVISQEQPSLWIVRSVRRKMILVLLPIAFCASFVNSQLLEDSCQLPNGESGICTTTERCPHEYEAALAEKHPEKLCDNDSLTTIVCCSSSTQTTTETIPIGDGRGEIARQKCEEYAKYVYQLKYSPILSAQGNQQLVNVSQCASRVPIVNDSKAVPKEFPHTAAVGFNDEAGILWLCSGTLISEKFVMTTAKSIDSPRGKPSWVRVGDLNLVQTNDDADPQDRKIVRWIKHPDFKKPSVYHDIALLELETPVKFSGYARPACLHTSPTIDVRIAIATAWGHIYRDEDGYPEDLMRVTLSLVSQPTCNASYDYDRKLRNGIVGDWQICAVGIDRDTCQGFSGAPLVIDSKSKHCMYDVIGVTSVGKACGLGTPGIYTRVYHYIPWIESIVWPQG